MSEEMLIRHCSPTLAGLKTGNMFRCAYESYEKLMNDIRCLNRRLACKGLRVIPLSAEEGSALIYVYRPSKLKCDINQDVALCLLRSLGYTCETPTGCLRQLMSRMREQGDFPHEVGLFLGYPPEDVCGFIENKAKCSKCTGTWKVYGDEEAARKTFALYRKCTNIYCAQHAKGKSIERLTVAD